MNSVWLSMGFIRFPLGLSVLIVVVLGIYSTIRLFREGATADPMTRTWLDAILFWGGFALVTGGHACGHRRRGPVHRCRRGRFAWSGVA